MIIIILLLKIYFGASLITAGLAKLDRKESFGNILTKQEILPKWSISYVVKYFPWFEMLLALLLVGSNGLLEIILIILTFILFLTFLVFKIILFYKNPQLPCGCYISAYNKKIDGNDLSVSFIIVILAGFQLWLVSWVEPVNWLCNVIIFFIFVSFNGFILTRIILRNNYRKRIHQVNL